LPPCQKGHHVNFPSEFVVDNPAPQARPDEFDQFGTVMLRGIQRRKIGQLLDVFVDVPFTGMDAHFLHLLFGDNH
jgi:hypothetical protein